MVDSLLYVLEAGEEDRIGEGRSSRGDRQSLIADPLEVFDSRDLRLMSLALFKAGTLVGGLCTIDRISLVDASVSET